MSTGPDWPGLFRMLAEGWNWLPAWVQGLTPEQLTRLSPDAAKNPTAGGVIEIAHPSMIEDYRRKWLAFHSPEAKLARAERRFEKYLAANPDAPRVS